MIRSALFSLVFLAACDRGLAYPGETGDGVSLIDEDENEEAKASSSTRSPDETPSEKDESEAAESSQDSSDPETLDDPDTPDGPDDSWDTSGESTSTSTTTTTTTTTTSTSTTSQGTTTTTTADETVEPDKQCIAQCKLDVDQEFANIQLSCRDLDTCPRQACIRKSWNYKYHGVTDCAVDCHYPPDTFPTEQCLADCSDEAMACAGNTCASLDCINANNICRGQCQ